MSQFRVLTQLNSSRDMIICPLDQVFPARLCWCHVKSLHQKCSSMQRHVLPKVKFRWALFAADYINRESISTCPTNFVNTQSQNGPRIQVRRCHVLFRWVGLEVVELVVVELVVVELVVVELVVVEVSSWWRRRWRRSSQKMEMGHGMKFGDNVHVIMLLSVLFLLNEC